jgi:signal transduction histidine kinase
VDVTRAEVEARRRRVVVSVFVLLTAMAAFAVTLSFLGPEVTDFLESMPSWARAAFLALALGFIALAWERERNLERLSNEVERQHVLVTSFQARLGTLEELIERSDVKAAKASVDDVMRVVLDAAVDLAGAPGGSLELLPREDSPAALVSVGAAEGSDKFSLPLRSEGRDIGVLTLEGRERIDAIVLDALQRFTEAAGDALERARHTVPTAPSGAYLQAANTVKTRFLATVSHELRTPLTSIVGYSTTLQNHWDRLPEVNKREFVHAIHKESSRLARLVERILEAASMEMQGVAIKPVVHDVRASVNNALQPFLDSEADRIKVQMPQSPLNAEVDPFVVHEVVSNLTDNALRYTKGQVAVSVDGDRRAIRITVSDEGSGIELEKLQRAKRGVYSIEESVESGTGLGLHVVYALVRDHGGQVDIQSGHSGTRARITLFGGATRLRAADNNSGAGPVRPIGGFDIHLD